MFFRQDLIKSEGRRHTHQKVNTRPVNVYRAHQHNEIKPISSPDTRIRKSEKHGRPSAYKAIPCVRERIRPVEPSRQR